MVDVDLSQNNAPPSSVLRKLWYVLRHRARPDGVSEIRFRPSKPTVIQAAVFREGRRRCAVRIVFHPSTTTTSRTHERRST